MTVYKLSKDISFPHPMLADEDGLLAVGGDYSVERMLLAYNHGIFPWYKHNGIIYWYATNPRMVVFPEKFKPNHGLKRILKKNIFETTINQEFEKVINFCSKIKRKDNGSWINNSYKNAFKELYEKGYAVSIETWCEDKLVGGLYGIIVKNGFCGESMFSAMPNASKVAFCRLMDIAKKLNWKFIDAQQDTAHIRTLCGELISFEEYYSMLTA